MGFWQEFKNQTRGSKLLFNFLFHGFHVGMFALGWLVAEFIQMKAVLTKRKGTNKNQIKDSRL